MRWSKTLQLVEAHAEGEIGRVVTGGLPTIPGAKLADKFRYLLGEREFRHSLCLEPRGAAAGSVVLIFPPDDEKNHSGLIVLQPDQAHAMSGSNAICTTTVLLETGMVEMKEGLNTVRLETAAGIVEAQAICANGKCEGVTLAMPPSFVERLDYEFPTSDWGTLKTDIAFGGVYYALIDADQLGLRIEPANARQLADAGMAFKEKLNGLLNIVHPENPDIKGIAYVMFRDKNDQGELRTATTMWPGRLDRSPCGTGNSAHLATMAARSQIEPGTTFVSRSVIGSRFDIQHGGYTLIGNQQAVLPMVSGRGWIYGMHQVGFDPSDPFAGGFALTDTWGRDAGLV